MDELELLAGARPAAPPSPEMIARSRAALIQLAAAQATETTRPARTRWTLRLRAPILVPALATVLVVITVVALSLNSGAPNQVTSPSVPSSKARTWDSTNAPQLLLVAAEQAQQQQAPGARTYWVSTVELGSLFPVGPNDNRYAIMTRRTQSSWKPLVPGKDYVLVSRWAGAEPASDKDKAAWRAAGSPASWPAGDCDPSRVYTAAPGGPETGVRISLDSPPSASGPNGSVQVRPSSRPPYFPLFTVVGENLTAEQIRALPSDPDALRAWLLGIIEKQNLPRGNPVETGESLFDAVLTLVLGTPVTPAVRAAAFRVLAGVPGIRSLGTVTDAKGRSGVAVSVDRNDTVEEQRADSGGPMEVSLLFDPDTGAVLGRQDRALRPADYMSWVPAGSVVAYELVESVRWTDDEPPAMPLSPGWVARPAC
ncbi:CU044_5270 family protein [Catelliglobosispora koreensis]|uniref:CU044_5270 family protein n=1 Tax=Catelliglobosispora koreensis TaxID=129052 RepID=UPI000361D16D|nr:CU044_5270 family protein [Catelliglobosispora koreensis]